jgi:hypothetical protein
VLLNNPVFVHLQVNTPQSMKILKSLSMHPGMGICFVNPKGKERDGLVERGADREGKEEKGVDLVGGESKKFELALVTLDECKKVCASGV